MKTTSEVSCSLEDRVHSVARGSDIFVVAVLRWGLTM